MTLFGVKLENCMKTPKRVVRTDIIAESNLFNRL